MADNKDKKVLNVPALRFPEFSDEWEKCLISDFGMVITGNTPPTKDVDNYKDGIKLWASPIDLGKSKWIYDTQTKLSVTGFEKTRKLPQGAILVTCIGSTIGKMGMATCEMATNQQINSIITNSDNDKDFVYYAIESKFPKYLTSVAIQAVPIISKSSFERLPNIRTTLTEQKKIGRFLSLIDKRIETQNKIIEDLRLLRDAISVCLLSPKSDWKCYKVSEIADIGRGRVISSKEIANQNNPQYPVYSSQTSNEGIMGYLDNYAFDGEYITWTTDGANAGTVFYRNGRFNCTNVCGTLKLHYQFDAYYCSLVLANATKKFVSVNLANPKLMNNTMAAIKFYLPPFQEQKRMAQLFRKMDENITLEHKLLLSYQKQKHYLLQQMFI